MSIKVASYVWEHSKQKASALLMLLAIADNANDQGEAFPGVETLAKKTRMSKRNAQDVLTKLEAQGEIAIQERDGNSNLYIIPVPWRTVEAKSKHIQRGMKRTAPPRKIRGMKPASPRDAVGFMGGVQWASPEPLFKRYLTLCATKAARTVVSIDGLNDFLKALAEFADSKRDVVFESVCLSLFEIPHTHIQDKNIRGRINGVAKTARSSFETAYAAHFTSGWTRALEDKLARAIEAFVKDWTANNTNTSPPLARDKYGTHFLKFLQTYNGNGSKPKPTTVRAPRPEPTPEERAALAEARRTIRPPWEKKEMTS
jgi:hypothetical protein